LIILGIDPGFAITGYGVLNYIGNQFKVMDFGVITTSADLPHPQRLLLLEKRLVDIIIEYKPETMSVEELFFNNNAKTALQVGQGRGLHFFVQPVPAYLFMSILQSR